MFAILTPTPHSNSEKKESEKLIPYSLKPKFFYWLPQKIIHLFSAYKVMKKNIKKNYSKICG